MITVKTFGSRLEAEIAKGLLESHGIYALVFCDDQGGLSPSMTFISGADLKVREEDRYKAQQLLAEPFEPLD